MRQLTLRQLFAAAIAAGDPPKMTVRTGPHGEKVGLLGYGAMRLPTVDGGHANPWGENMSKAAIDQAIVNEQIDYALAHGMNYFDTSPCYCRGESEKVLAAALKRHPRDTYFISTKLSNFAASQHSAEACRKMFEESLRIFGTDRIDFYYLHNTGAGGMSNFESRYVKNGIIPWLFEQKKKGRIRNLGFSYHGDPKTLEWVLAKHDAGVYRWDMGLIQLNYVDWHHAKEVNAQNQNAEYLYNELTRRGIAVTVMEPLLGGKLARRNDAVMAELAPLDPQATPANWAFRFAGTHPNVLTVLSGTTFKEHLVENCATFSPLRPISKAEGVALERAAAAYLGCGAVPCNYCNYCMPCPYGIDIPGILRFVNEIRFKKISDPGTILRLYAKAVPDPRRRADRCIGCARCVGHCPQTIDIPKVLDGVASLMEGLAS